MAADDLRLIPGFSEESVAALVRADLWRYAVDGFEITDFIATQTSKTQLEGLEDKKRGDRERQARKRARDKGLEPPVVSRDNPRDVTRDTQDRQGQARARRSKGEGVREGSNGHVFDEHDNDFVAAREAV
jgi:hypothetical protein